VELLEGKVNADVVALHVPPPQLVHAAQLAPQEPQLLLSLERLLSQPSLATPLQLPKPLLQISEHEPPEHTAVADGPPGQTTPQPPQLLGSLDVLTHAPPHLVVPPLHVSVQLPETHASPAAHAWPQLPQFAESLERSTHDAPHFVVPLPHSATHAPDTHSSPDVHALAHAPQFFGSRETSTQSAPHLVVPVGQPLGTSEAVVSSE